MSTDWWVYAGDTVYFSWGHLAKVVAPWIAGIVGIAILFLVLRYLLRTKPVIVDREIW